MTAEPEVQAVPRIIHTGTYALWETPDGGRHLVYRQQQCAAEDGTLADVDSGDLHLPDFPPAALPLVSAFLENGFPPAILALLGTMANGKGLSKSALARALPGLIGGLGNGPG